MSQIRATLYVAADELGIDAFEAFLAPLMGDEWAEQVETFEQVGAPGSPNVLFWGGTLTYSGLDVLDRLAAELVELRSDVRSVEVRKTDYDANPDDAITAVVLTRGTEPQSFSLAMVPDDIADQIKAIREQRAMLTFGDPWPAINRLLTDIEKGLSL